MYRVMIGVIIAIIALVGGIGFWSYLTDTQSQTDIDAAFVEEARVQVAVLPTPDVQSQPIDSSTMFPQPHPMLPGADDPPIQWIVTGGGALPEMNQISLEQDAQLAISRLPGFGRIFFAAGTGSQTVQVQTQPMIADELEFALGEIFQPRGGRDSTYRAVTILNAQAATKEATLTTIKAALGQGQKPLLVAILGHGDQGEVARDNLAGFWPGDTLTAAELTAELDSTQTQRMTRFVITTCFSGGFAEMVFHDADPDAGVTHQDRCGLFSATWDLEASGCDPNPDRRAQEGFGQHFWHALSSEDRLGQPLDRHQIDADKNGEISLLEAHGWVRITSASLEVPTTTSERWLRHVAPAEGPEEDVSLPVEDMVIAQLRSRLNTTTLEEAQKQLEVLQQQSQTALDKVTEAQEKEEKAFRMLAGELLSRWPVLDDPYHPAYRSMLTEQRDVILALLERHELSRTFQNQLREAERAQIALEDSRVRSAPLHRLMRALENRQLARRLKAQGGKNWQLYQRFLACENTVP